MKESEKFIPINTDEIEWQDGEKILGLPPGLKAKIIAEAYDEVHAATCWSRMLAFYRDHVR